MSSVPDKILSYLANVSNHAGHPACFFHVLLQSPIKILSYLAAAFFVFLEWVPATL